MVVTALVLETGRLQSKKLDVFIAFCEHFLGWFITKNRHVYDGLSKACHDYDVRISVSQAQWCRNRSRHFFAWLTKLSTTEQDFKKFLGKRQMSLTVLRPTDEHEVIEIAAGAVVSQRGVRKGAVAPPLA